MHRVEQNETFHGTAAGQVPNSRSLEERFGLSERQAQCAALLRMGTPSQAVAEVLGVSASTLETHLAELRQRFATASTAQLCQILEREITSTEVAAFHCWPAATNGSPDSLLCPRDLAASFRSCMSVEQALTTWRDALSDFRVQFVYYCFVPLSVQGFIRDDVHDVFLAPEPVKQAFAANGGLRGQPIADLLFNRPTEIPLVDINPASAPSNTLASFYHACQAHGASHLLALGFPSGPAFVGMACTLERASEAEAATIADHTEEIRSAAMAMHASLLTNSALASRLRLTLRERNALSATALGKRNTEAARDLGVSERAYAKLLSSARKKLNAQTNAEATTKAALINALVFL